MQGMSRVMAVKIIGRVNRLDDLITSKETFYSGCLKGKQEGQNKEVRDGTLEKAIWAIIQ